MPFEIVELWINRVRINHSFWAWNDRIVTKYLQQFWIKWNFELTVFELTVPDLYYVWIGIYSVWLVAIE